MTSGIFNRPFGRRDTDYNVIPDSYSDEAFRGDYDMNNNLIYKGFARPGADEDELVWQIAYLTYDGNNNITSIVWPQTTQGNASNDYIFSWTDRTSYTYS